MNHLAVPKQTEELSLTRVSGGASGALAAFSQSSSTKPRERTSTSLSSVLLSIFFILMGSIFPSNSLDPSFRNNNFIHCCAFQLVEQDELSTTFGQKELGKKNEFHTTFLWDQELEELLVDQPCPLDLFHGHLGQEHLWNNQLQQHFSENETNKKLDKNKELEQKNFQSLIYEKLVALLPEKHFALAAYTQLLGNEAWEKSREASQISFDKVRGKEPPPELRRDKLDLKDLRSDSFRALCPTSFEENSFTEENLTESSLTTSSFTRSSLTDSSLTRSSFHKTSFADSNFTENSFQENNFTEGSFTKSSLTESSLTESSLPENSFAKNGLRKKSFDKTSFSENTFLKKNFSQKHFDKQNFDKQSFDKKSFDKKSFDKKSFDKQTFNEQLRAQQLGGTELLASSFEASSFENSSFTHSNFEESSLTKSSFRASSFRGNSFEEKSCQQAQLSGKQLRSEQLQTAQLRREQLRPGQLGREQLEDRQL